MNFERRGISGINRWGAGPGQPGVLGDELERFHIVAVSIALKPHQGPCGINLDRPPADGMGWGFAMDSGFDLARYVFFGFIAVTVPIAAVRIFHQLRTRAPLARAQLAERGYATEHTSDGDGNVGTRVWGELAAPTALYLELSNRPGLRKLLGVSDVKIGDPTFDGAFWLRSNNSELARCVLDVACRERLLSLPDVEFQTGSPATLLSADYWPKEKEAQRRRSLWMVRTMGRKSDAELAPFLEVGRRLAAAIERVVPRTGNGDATRTSTLEGV